VSKRLNLSQNFIDHLVAPSLELLNPLHRYPIPRGTPSAGEFNTRGGKNWRFLTQTAIYLGNGVRQADGYYGTLIGSHWCQIEWYHFQWPWV